MSVRAFEIGDSEGLIVHPGRFRAMFDKIGNPEQLQALSSNLGVKLARRLVA